MLARVTGILERIDESTAVVMIPGAQPGFDCAYEVMLPAFLAQSLADRVGGPITLHTIQSIESPDQGASFVPRIIGFSATPERRFFELLTTVKGVGTKKALRALAAPVGEVARAITLRDASALSRLPGIGKRLAETIIAELHGKVEAFAGESIMEGKPSSGAERGAQEPFHRAVAALVRLGETQADADRLVRRALEGDAALATADELVAAALGMR
ncbi:MAG: ATP-dependent DNA helicase RuvA [Phycisphaerae bacterium]|nr:ATP-dependent DNA helicase RuvA [Phycisphaerae bacterium]